MGYLKKIDSEFSVEAKTMSTRERIEDLFARVVDVIAAIVLVVVVHFVGWDGPSASRAPGRMNKPHQ